MLSLSDPIFMILVLLVVAAAPFAVMMVTSFTKIIIVLSLVRNALGLQQVPPAIVLNGLAMVLTIFIMYPVGLATYKSAQETLPDSRKPVTIADLAVVAGNAKEPLKTFLMKHSKSHEREFFRASAKIVMGEEVAAMLTEKDFVILVPAFISTELTEAFEIGFLIFLPFLLIDLIAAASLMALGMQMVSPTTISLPFKLLLLVMLDGWTRLLHALILTYR